MGLLTLLEVCSISHLQLQQIVICWINNHEAISRDTDRDSCVVTAEEVIDEGLCQTPSRCQRILLKLHVLHQVHVTSHPITLISAETGLTAKVM